MSVVAFVFPPVARQTYVLSVHNAGVILVTGVETRFSQLSIPCKQPTAELIKRHFLILERLLIC